MTINSFDVLLFLFGTIKCSKLWQNNSGIYKLIFSQYSLFYLQEQTSVFIKQVFQKSFKFVKKYSLL